MRSSSSKVLVEDDDDCSSLIPQCADTCTGLLANGMRYYYVRRDEQAVELSVIVRCGSRDEGDDERGVAHAIEHLVARKLMSEELTSLTAVSAYTGWDRTVYMATSPLQSGLVELLSRQIFEVDFDRESIKKESRIILEERRQEVDAESRCKEAFLAALFEGTLLGKCASVIGVNDEKEAEALANAGFRGLHGRRYTPDRTAIVVVGEAGEEAVLVTMLEATFGRQGSREDPADLVEIGETAEGFFLEPTLALGARHFLGIKEQGIVRVSVYEDDEIGRCATSLTCLSRVPFAEEFRVVNRLVELCLVARLELRGWASGLFELPSVEVDARLLRGELRTSHIQLSSPSDAESAVEAAWSEVEAARLEGFTDEEVAKAAKKLQRQERTSAAARCQAHFMDSAPLLDTESDVASASSVHERLKVLFPPLKSPDADYLLFCARKPASWTGGRVSGFTHAAAHGPLLAALHRARPITQDPLEEDDDVPPFDADMKTKVRRHDLGESRTALEIDLLNGSRVVFVRSTGSTVHCCGLAAGGLSELLTKEFSDDALASAALAAQYEHHNPRPGSSLLHTAVLTYSRLIQGEAASLEAALISIRRLFFGKKKKKNLARFRDFVLNNLTDPNENRFQKLLNFTASSGHPLRRPLRNPSAFEADLAHEYHAAAFGSPRGFTIALAGDFKGSTDARLEALAVQYLGPVLEEEKKTTLLLEEQKKFGLADNKGDALLPSGLHRIGPLFPQEHALRELRFRPPAASVFSLQKQDQQLLGSATEISLPLTLTNDGHKNRRRKTLEPATAATRLEVQVGAEILQERLIKSLRGSESLTYRVVCELRIDDVQDEQGGVLSAWGAGGLVDDQKEAELRIHASHDDRDAGRVQFGMLREVCGLMDADCSSHELNRALAIVGGALRDARTKDATWVRDVARTFLEPNYRGSLGETFRARTKIEDETLASLADSSKKKGPALLRRAWARSLASSQRGARRAGVTLRSRASLFAASQQPVFLVALIAATATVGAYGYYSSQAKPNNCHRRKQNATETTT